MNILKIQTSIYHKQAFKGESDILVVDHRQDNLNFYMQHLDKLLGDSYNIQGTTDPQEALNIAKETKPVLTVSCYNFQGINVRDFYRKLHEIGSKVLVASSVYYDNGDESRRAGKELIEDECGADKYVYGGGYDEYYDRKMFDASVIAILNREKPPEYTFPYEE